MLVLGKDIFLVINPLKQSGIYIPYALTFTNSEFSLQSLCVSYNSQNKKWFFP
jgi:hypothetical protein